MTALPDDPSNKDWFSDGRDAARRLKLELGLDTKNEDLGNSNENLDDGEESRLAALERGRAAARALLEQMNGDNDLEDQNMDSTTAIPDGNEIHESVAHNQYESIQRDQFDLPLQKSHCMTICMVPPPSAKSAWSQLTNARRACKDPGFFRWPPHANLLYPFVEPGFSIEKDLDKATHNMMKEEVRIQFMKEVAKHLSKAAQQCMPFDVNLESFGCFGGKTRGVLWADPISSYSTTSSNDANAIAPLIHLQNQLEKQFPMCKDQKKQGQFTPHMTISHYANMTDALSAKEQVQSTWKPLAFHVSEVYLLQRKGDEGQFKIAATIPLGPDSNVQIHDPPLSFPDMPLLEEDWVLNERMKMKDRRKRNFKRNRGQGDN
jgi:2'-5' RNA ligase